MKSALIAMLVPFATVACGGSGDDTESDAPPAVDAPVGTVSIDMPTAGAQVSSAVTVQLSSTVQIVPAGDLTPATGHHHIYLDADLTAADVPVPSVPGSIIHMGDGSSTYTFEDLAPGEHRLIAVVADGVHVPLQPWVVDTLTFTVNN